MRFYWCSLTHISSRHNLKTKFLFIYCLHFLSSALSLSSRHCVEDVFDGMGAIQSFLLPFWPVVVSFNDLCYNCNNWRKRGNKFEREQGGGVWKLCGGKGKGKWCDYIIVSKLLFLKKVSRATVSSRTRDSETMTPHPVTLHRESEARTKLFSVGVSRFCLSQSKESLSTGFSIKPALKVLVIIYRQDWPAQQKLAWNQHFSFL